MYCSFDTRAGKTDLFRTAISVIMPEDRMIDAAD